MARTLGSIVEEPVFDLTRQDAPSGTEKQQRRRVVTPPSRRSSSSNGRPLVSPTKGQHRHLLAIDQVEHE